MRTKLSGYFTIPVVASLSLVLISASLVSLRGSKRAQSAARDSVLSSETGVKDLGLQRSGADQVVSDLVNVVNSSANNLTRTLAPRPVNHLGGSAAGILGSNITDAAGSMSSSFASVGTSILNLAPWSSQNSGYTQISVPSNVQRLGGVGATFVGRRMDLNYTRTKEFQDKMQSNAGVDRSGEATRRITIYEIPTQTAVAGRRVNVGATAVAGAVAARSARLGSASVVNGGLTVWNRIRLDQGAQVSGRTVSAPVDAPVGGAVAKQIETGSFTGGQPLGSSDLSMIRPNEWATWVDLGDRTAGPEGISRILLPSTAPTLWDAYTKPFYQCRTRITVALAADALSAAVTIRTAALDTLANRRLAGNVTGSFTLSRDDIGQSGLALRQGPGNENILTVDPIALGSGGVYIDFTTSGGQRLASSLFISLINASNLSLFGGWSLVTPNRVLLTREINTVSPVPLSIFSPEVRYGLANTAPTLNFTGQIASVADGEELNVASRLDSSGNAAATTAFTLSNLTTGTQVPPVTLKSWLVLAENADAN